MRLPIRLSLPAFRLPNRLAVLLPALVMAGCSVQQAYYVSPFNGNHHSYHPLPLQADSARSAYYLGAAIGFGAANDNETDQLSLFQAHVSGGHNFRPLQVYYSLGLSMGKYIVAANNALWRSSYFYGGGGAEAGINAVVPFRNGEWRIIGVEGSLRQEFGDYLAFRKGLAPAAADLIVRNSRFSTFGGYSEVVFRGPYLTSGIRLAGGTVLGKAYHHLQLYDRNEGRWLTYRYVNMALHTTLKRYNGFLQVNFATKASTTTLGLNYRLGK